MECSGLVKRNRQSIRQFSPALRAGLSDDAGLGCGVAQGYVRRTNGVAPGWSHSSTG
jgi:hypothetical protein